tara:strand:+ start:305 stop:556 length:252 start_codon:yes stop_codon:yes gene_type:complete
MKKNLLLFLLLFSNSSFSSYQLETVLSDLDDAWSFVFLSEDKILYTEMPGKLKIASLSNTFIKEKKSKMCLLFSMEVKVDYPR